MGCKKMADIIQFPKNNRGNIEIIPSNDNIAAGEDPTGKLLDEQIKKLLDQADEMADSWIDHLATQFDEAEIAEMSSEYYRDLHHVGEAIRSLIYRHLGIPHPFQKYVDNMIKLRYDNGAVIASWEDEAFENNDE